MGISSHGIKLAEPGAGAGEQDVAQRVERVLSLAREIAALPILEEGSPDEIVGYDEFGAPG